MKSALWVYFRRAPVMFATHFSKVSSIVIVHRTFRTELTFEDFRLHSADAAVMFPVSTVVSSIIIVQTQLSSELTFQKICRILQAL